MDQHPVPQNVTTFQFRLIGDMTIKQFGHLAGGAILAYISYKLPLPFFFSWPLTIIFALGGVGFAFVPIEERPMDVWVMSFLKNVYSPTLYVWEKTPTKPVATPQKVAPVVAYQAPQRQAVQQQPNTRTTASVIGTMYAPKAVPARSPSAWSWFDSLFSKKQQPIAPAIPSQAPHMAMPTVVGTHLDMSVPPIVTKLAPDPKRNEEAEEREEILEEKLTTLQHELRSNSMSEARILELQKQLSDVLTQKDQMKKEMEQMQSQIQSASMPKTVLVSAPDSSPPPTPQHQAPIAQAQKQPTVKIITPEGAVRAGLPRLTTFPNVVTGITKDSDNNFLPGVLITVKDKDSVPVRALKTNRLGQFAASTPLSNGVYFVEIEDPRQRYTFDRVQITLNGSIVPALEIITKSQKQIDRDKLTKELFGSTT